MRDEDGFTDYGDDQKSTNGSGSVDWIEKLIAATAADPGAPFAEDLLVKLWRLRESDTYLWQKTRERLKKAKCAGIGELEKQLNKIAAQVRREERVKAAREQKLSVIKIMSDGYDLVAQEVEDALITADLGVYARGANLCYLTSKEENTGTKNPATGKPFRVVTTQFQSMEVSTMRMFMDQAAIYEGEFGEPITPPEEIAKLLIAKRGKWRIPQALAISKAQTIDSDGTIIDKPGVHAASGLLLANLPLLPPMPAEPTFDDALASAIRLAELFKEYRFADGPKGPSRTVAMSTLMTPVARGGIVIAPLHGSSAPSGASGKSLIADMAHAILAGTRCPVLTAVKNAEEREKIVASALMSGYPIISLDNVNGELRSDILAQAVEREIVMPRPFGKLELREIRQRSTWIVNGNRLTIQEDMMRRSLMVFLDRGEAHPERHVYKQRPLEMILANRGRFIADILIMIRAYIVAGRPGLLTPIASYDDWSAMVRSALVWLGFEDPALTMELIKAEDDDSEMWNVLFEVWPPDIIRDGWVTVTVKELCSLAEELLNMISQLSI